MPGGQDQAADGAAQGVPDAADDVVEAHGARRLALGGDGQDDAGHRGREAADAEAEHAHRREQFGQVRPGRREQDEPATDDDGAAGQEQGVVDPRRGPEA